MANTPQARKRIRRNERRAEINGNRLSRIRTFVKKVDRRSPVATRPWRPKRSRLPSRNWPVALPVAWFTRTPLPASSRV
jgi:hypothetical protein